MSSDTGRKPRTWPAFPERYEVLEFVAAGGMGEVWRLRDLRLDRELAGKVLLAGRIGAGEGRFEREARTLARLDHPAVVGIIDIGILEDGRPWFTMPLIEGRTLRELVDEAHSAGMGSVARRRLLDTLRTVAHAVAYAHERGVVHRDIKPANVMVGSHGEVFVLDWGISRLGGAEDLVAEELLGPGTRVGTVLGTPGYLAPEQASGDPELHVPSVDVYALGATLYTVLVGRVPSANPWDDDVELMSMPPDLSELVSAAMSRRGSRRPSASAFAKALGDHLDGARRAEMARKLVEEARPDWRRLGQLEREANAAEESARRALQQVPPHAPIEKKRPAWAMEDLARDIRLQAELAQLKQVQTVQGALNIDPECAEAHEDLADHYADQLKVAETANDPTRALRSEWLLREHDRGRHEALLRGHGRLTLDSDPSGARARLQRFEERDRRLVPGKAQDLGRTPVDVQLAAGSYLVTLTHPSGQETRYPALIRRGGTWAEAPVHLPEHIEDGWCYVPAGPAIIGGDPEAADPLPLGRPLIEGFLMRRFPVAVAEYKRFLEETGLDEHAPLRNGAAWGLHMGGAGWEIRDDWEPDHPVGGLSWHAAVACAEWLGGRLPTEVEWEKAARGVDGRGFVWGSSFETTFANVLNARRGTPGPCPLLEFPSDETVHGVRGLGGNIRDWCANAYLAIDGTENPAYRVLRGGAWNNTAYYARAASRFAAAPERAVSLGGVRPVRRVR